MDGYTHESTIAMQPGDIFVGFSDGGTEPENESGEFGEERLIELIREHRHQPLSRIGDVITGSVWTGSAVPNSRDRCSRRSALSPGCR